MRGILRKISQMSKGTLTVLLLLFGAGEALGVTQYTPRKMPFLYDITTFTTTLSLPVQDQLETIKPSTAKMRERLQRSQKDTTVEPLSVTFANDEAEIRRLAEKIAAPGQSAALALYLHGIWKDGAPISQGSDIRTSNINQHGFDLIDSDAFADLYSRTHHKLTIDGALLQKNPSLRRDFLAQLSPFFSKEERKKIAAQIKAGDKIDVDQSTLPDFAAKMVSKYIIYRGPNCFHAALAFQSPKLASSSLINVKNEKGYHRAMINYDELWRVINSDFYEVDPDKVPLKYGDMLVLFDVPKDEHLAAGPVNFHWIRHAATYLFGGYTFSKGSKSPNTPYTIRTLSEEWNTWKRYTDNLGIKVFRRSEKHVRSHPPMDLADWIY